MARTRSLAAISRAQRLAIRDQGRGGLNTNPRLIGKSVPLHYSGPSRRRFFLARLRRESMTVRCHLERMPATVLAALHATMLLVVSPVFAVEPAQSSAWKLDAVHLKSGITFRGMLVKETEAEIYFQNVRRHPGRATAV